MKNLITSIVGIGFGIVSAYACLESLKFALTTTSRDPAQAAQDGPKTIGGRLAALLVAAFTGLIFLIATETAFFGRIVWIPFF